MSKDEQDQDQEQEQDQDRALDRVPPESCAPEPRQEGGAGAAETSPPALAPPPSGSETSEPASQERPPAQGTTASPVHPTREPPSSRRRRRRSRRLTDEDRAEIVRLAEEVGMGTREIAKRLGLGRKQVRAALAAQGLEGTRRAPARQRSQLDSFRALVSEKVAAGLTITRILREIVAEGYTGGRTVLAEYVRSLRQPHLPRRQRPKRRFETPVAEELQGDFGTYSVLVGGVRTTVHAFISCLGYSRKVSADVFRDQRQATVFEALDGAFRDFEGVSRYIVIDNITAIVLGRTEVAPGKRQPLLHASALLYARHYATEFAPARPYHPDRKGKDENLVGFFERDVIRGSTFESWEDLRQRAREWAQRVNQRRHGTTGRVPDEVWRSEERALLTRLPEERFAVHHDEPRAVASDSTLSLGGTPYTVPAELAGSVVMVRLYAHHFEVQGASGAVVFARGYVDPKDKGRLQLDPAHYASLPRSGPRERGRAKRLDETFRTRFPGLGPLVDGITRRMKTLAHVHLAALLRLADRFGEEAFLAVATRVQEAHRYDARAVERVLERDHPLTEEALPLATLGGAGALLLADVEEGTLERVDALDEGAANDAPGTGADDPGTGADAGTSADADADADAEEAHGA